jgi:nucleoside-diphosphate-sugar epimerase
VDVVVHGAWQFNPTRNAAAEDELDIVGTENILRFVLANKVGHLVYPGSTTAYAPIPENPSEEPFLREEDWETNKEKRKRADYRYSRNKAIVDEMIQKFAERHPDISIFLMRGAIVVGPNTRNIVSYIARSPFTFGKLMFRVRGYDPPMQFISERDTAEILYRATMDRWRGVYNVAGRGTIRYSEVIRSLGRREAVLPPGVLYPFVGALWRARVFPFPPALLDLVRYPWVADISKLEKLYVPLDTSREAIESFGKAMNRQ